MKTTPWFRFGALLAGLCSTTIAQVPTVSIAPVAFPARTMEPCPVCRVAPVELTLSRTGPVTDALDVHLITGGTATSGVDYATLPETVTIPAGQTSEVVKIFALDDALPEGLEVVTVTVRDGTALYNVAAPGEVHAVIGDDEEGAPVERLDYTTPANGTVFASGVGSITLEAMAVSITREIDVPVEFLANGVKIGQSSPIGFGRPPIPGLPREHEFVWTHPADGNYTLTARTAVTADTWLEAPPIQIKVGKPAASPVISITTTSRVAEEDSAPTMRPMRLRGEFTVSRTGSTASAQPVYLHVSGSALPARDYTALPLLVTIPAGADSITVPVDAIPDIIAEPLETVVAEVSNCPPGALDLPCYDFEIDPAHQRDTVLIRDDGITNASLEMTAPLQGAQSSTGDDVVMDLTALDILGGITRVDFYAGNLLIGSSELHFLVPPPPGRPIHHTFTWTTPLAGTYTLTARATSLSGTPVTSPPVTIIVAGNRVPAVLVISPAEGAQIPSGQPVNMTVQATDPDGYTSIAEFYADGHKVGEVTMNFFVAPPPGGTQTFTFTWNGAPPGTHVMSARVRDDDGVWGTSPPVPIVITTQNSLPVVTAYALDPFAVEPFAAQPANTATIHLRRHGSVSGPLSVNYSLSGNATNGTDYITLNGVATFSAGEATTPIIISPLPDDQVENREKVIISVDPQFDDGPQRYEVGTRHVAIAIIADYSWVQAPPASDACTPLEGGYFHLRFPAPSAVAGFRIEATSDFLTWETVHEAASVEDALDFVDPDTPGRPLRFYRMAPETASDGL